MKERPILTLADKRDTYNFYPGQPLELSDCMKYVFRPTRWLRFRRALEKALCFWRPNWQVSEIDAEAGTVTVVQRKWWQ